MARSSTTRHGKGEGHGPAKGAGTGGAAHLFGPARGGGTREGFTSETGRAMGEDQVMLARIKAERSLMLEDHLFKLATGAEREDTQVSAAVRLHAIYNGTPVARNLNEHAGADGGPIQHTYSWAEPEPDEETHVAFAESE